MICQHVYIKNINLLSTSALFSDDVFTGVRAGLPVTHMTS